MCWQLCTAAQEAGREGSLLLLTGRSAKALLRTWEEQVGGSTAVCLKWQKSSLSRQAAVRPILSHTEYDPRQWLTPGVLLQARSPF